MEGYRAGYQPLKPSNRNRKMGGLCELIRLMSEGTLMNKQTRSGGVCLGQRLLCHLAGVFTHVSVQPAAPYSQRRMLWMFEEGRGNPLTRG